ncbi:MAG: AAA family ATPase [Sulfurovum sp.]|nr:AAA family ATPase [Sulfurovum sp.]
MAFFDSSCQEICKDNFFDSNVILLYDEDIESESYLNEFNMNKQVSNKLKIDSKYVFNNISVSFLFNNNQEFLKNFKFIPTHIELETIVKLKDNDFKNLMHRRFEFPNDMLDIREIFTIDSQDIENLKIFLENKLSRFSDEIEDVKNYLYLREFIYKLNNNHSSAYEIAETIIKHNKFQHFDDVDSFFQRKLENLFDINEEIFHDIIKSFGNIQSIYDYSLDKLIIDINNKNLEKLLSNLHRHFFNIRFFKKTRRKNLYLNNLSNGERKLILLFANIFYTIRKLYVTENQKTFYILLDEPDIYLHPEWQKKIINLFRLFFSSNKIFETKKINLIFTTHSPFLLSDIPKQNIIFLDKNEKGNCKVVDGLKEKKQTFGANIHTLLSDSFFMEDGLMGEFAKGKIDKAIKLLNQDKLSKEDLKYCEQIISIIGEPIVKNQLQRMLDSKRLKKVDKIDTIEKDIKALQEELEKLKNDKN